jgi:hypothetical protein
MIRTLGTGLYPVAVEEAEDAFEMLDEGPSEAVQVVLEF